MGATLLGSRERIAGRIFGVAAEGGAHRFDLGPAWVWPALIDASVAQLGRLFGAQALTPRAVVLQDEAEEGETATPADAQPASAQLGAGNELSTLGQTSEAALPAASRTGSHTGENGGA